jgi:hypothetical protein
MPDSLRPKKQYYQAADDSWAWVLDDGETGVFSMGNFNAANGEISLMVGLDNLVWMLDEYEGGKKLIIDVVGLFRLS